MRDGEITHRGGKHQVESDVERSLECENHTQSPAEEVHGCDCIRYVLEQLHILLFDSELLPDVLWKSVLMDNYIEGLVLHE